MQKLSSTQKAYLAGFLDGDGSIYVRLKPNPTYKFGFQVAPYIIFFQSAKGEANFQNLCSLLNLGYMRKRKDGILEYTIGRNDAIAKFLSMVEPYVILKKKQVDLMLEIMQAKSLVKDEKSFGMLMKLIDSFRELNYSKKRLVRTLTL